MRKFTFIAEFRDGTYISQYRCDLLEEAVIKWAEGLSLEFFSKSIKRKIIENINEKEYNPVPLDGIENAWCVSYTIGRSLLLLNIVETV